MRISLARIISIQFSRQSIQNTRRTSILIEFHKFTLSLGPRRFKNKTKSYKLGDDLAGGTIVMIDYRQMPFPEKPALLSQSRVILSIEDDFWAIERGNTLADKHKLAPEKLPERLAKREL